MAHGTPSSVPTAARLTLHTATTALPTTAMRTILATVRPTGGATRPLRRRRRVAQPEVQAQRAHDDGHDDPALRWG